MTNRIAIALLLGLSAQGIYAFDEFSPQDPWEPTPVEAFRAKQRERRQVVREMEANPIDYKMFHRYMSDEVKLGGKKGAVRSKMFKLSDKINREQDPLKKGELIDAWKKLDREEDRLIAESDQGAGTFVERYYPHWRERVPSDVDYMIDYGRTKKLASKRTIDPAKLQIKEEIARKLQKNSMLYKLSPRLYNWWYSK